ncbi:DNA-3-methyladenine glycosylase [Solirubrobacter ginsenosidimutans]|uniref:DNA-3-methyladenine glycosylase II n=1 Tax=Solirubrobacter ginsenosidimutans TaxID=490573 RepID=A0A9X3MWZ5_9ACTN|nr:DNA-3-methyladenine glycosylase [Solirubrobacter ginsenosidimutans]MDA0162772.1 DNA-3-methyladenine glycosylase [Solirubrobacter ginsenosidimutans]
MAGLIKDFGGPLPKESRSRPTDVYSALLRAITGQQLSVKAAQAIYGRLIERFGGHPPTPEQLLADDPDAMRTAAGLSHAKVNALRSLAEHILAGELQLTNLEAQSDDEVMRDLVAVKGIGEWTAHMFLMFTLHRQDILATGDQGIKNAFKRAYGLDVVPKPDAMIELAEPWRPYRTRACEYLWRSLNNAPI